MQKCSALLALASISLTLNPCLSEAQSSASAATTTPIKHLVVIFDENISFDHYFGTYPNAANPPGEPTFTASPNTPTVNNLTGLCSTPTRTQPLRSALIVPKPLPATTTITIPTSRRPTTAG